jgi:hypothetical protein
MDKLDGKTLEDFKHWTCERDHVMGVIERVRVKVAMNGTTVEYFTKRLMIFRAALDLTAEIPAEIEVAGTLDGRMLSMVWRCNVPGCGCLREWRPDEDALDWLKNRYGAKTPK